ncbi:hypothetical protein DWW37_04695 [Bifidobacterium adolescentis]|nr:hypothetical protein DWW37_04695 [Bifidobacterium adolescentis]
MLSLLRRRKRSVMGMDATFHVLWMSQTFPSRNNRDVSGARMTLSFPKEERMRHIAGSERRKRSAA